ncbi:sigma-54 dependent transcriptional regulator [bacterium]|nr:sigma-54 dependent transcriptional regulator [bacterium]
MTPQLLVIDDQAQIRQFLREALGAEGYAVETAGTGDEAVTRLTETIPDLVLLDLRLPDTSGLDLMREIHRQFPSMCVVMMTAFGEIETAVKAIKAGAFDFIPKPFNLEQLLHVIKRGLETSRHARELYTLRRQGDSYLHSPGIVMSTAPAMQDIYETVRKVIVGDKTTILIEGESGVGKDVLAGLIHASSPRSAESFLEINCAALPEKLLESELFGHEQGAFTDALHQKPGLLELAHRGTLFLDEIGEMSLTLQVKLLRVLEKQTFRRVGGVQDISVDVRLISATNRDLSRMVAEGAFREDLYYRLKVIPLLIPPLRERPEDIPALADHFLRVYNLQFQRNFEGFSAGATAAMAAYAWPGNIRELRNVLERAVLLSDGNTLSAAQLNLPGAGEARSLPLWGDLASALGGDLSDDGIPLPDMLARIEEHFVRHALEAAGGNQSHAARLLGLNRDKLRYRMKQYGLNKDEPRERA